MESSIFVLELSRITFDDIKSFCNQGFSEGPRIEYKKDFPRNLKLAETICAFANTQGGIILIGVQAEKKTNRPAAIPGIELREGLEERVINLCLSHISPTISPQVKVCDFKSDPRKDVSDRAILFIRVRFSYMAPHYLLRDNKIWVRAHDRNSLADLPTIESLIGRREEVMSEGVKGNVSYDIREIKVDENEAYETVVVAPQFRSDPFIRFYTKEDSQWLFEISNEVMLFNEQKPSLWKLAFVNSLKDIYRYCGIEKTGTIAFQRRAIVQKDKFFSGESIILLINALKAVQKIYSRFGFYRDISVGLTIDNTKNLSLGFLPDYRRRMSRYLEDFRCNRNRIYVSKDLRYDELSHLKEKMAEVFRELCIQFEAVFPKKTTEDRVDELFSILSRRDGV